MTTADDFLKAAETLAHGDTEGHWRSAESRAYYAAFHCIIEAAVQLIFNETEVQQRFRSVFEHGAMSTVAASFATAPSRPAANAPTRATIDYQKRVASWREQVKKYDLHDPPGRDVQRLAGIFVALQRRRTAADYFPSESAPLTVSATEARQKVNDARRFCRLVNERVELRDSDFIKLVSEMFRASVRAPRR